MYKCLHEETEGVNVNLIHHLDRHQHTCTVAQDTKKILFLQNLRPNNLREHLDIQLHTSGIPYRWTYGKVKALILLNELMSILSSVYQQLS